MRSFFLILALLMLTGCGGGLRDKVAGSWKMDIGSVKGMPPSPEQKAAAEAIRWAFKEDGTLVVTGIGSPKRGKWELKDHEIKLTMEKAQDQQVAPQMTINDEGTRIHGENPAMQIDFVRS